MLVTPKDPLLYNRNQTMNGYSQLLDIMADLEANGVKPKVTVLKPKKAKQTAWIKGNGPTPHCGLHGINTTAGYNEHGNKAGKL